MTAEPAILKETTKVSTTASAYPRYDFQFYEQGTPRPAVLAAPRKIISNVIQRPAVYNRAWHKIVPLIQLSPSRCGEQHLVGLAAQVSPSISSAYHCHLKHLSKLHPRVQPRFSPLEYQLPKSHCLPLTPSMSDEYCSCHVQTSRRELPLRSRFRKTFRSSS